MIRVERLAMSLFVCIVSYAQSVYLFRHQINFNVLSYDAINAHHAMLNAIVVP